MPRRSAIQDVIEQFVERLTAVIEAEAVSRARDVVLQAFGGRAPAGLKLRGPGRPPGGAAVLVFASGARGRSSFVRCRAAPTVLRPCSEWSVRSTRTCRSPRSRSTARRGRLRSQRARRRADFPRDCGAGATSPEPRPSGAPNSGAISRRSGWHRRCDVCLLKPQGGRHDHRDRANFDPLSRSVKVAPSTVDLRSKR